MTENQIRAAQRLQLALLRKSKEKARDLFYIRQSNVPIA